MIMYHVKTLYYYTYYYIVHSAELTDYMLEKSRLISQQKGEKNFRIMYYFMAQVHHGQYGLLDPEHYKYVLNLEFNVNLLIH